MPRFIDSALSARNKAAASKNEEENKHTPPVLLPTLTMPDPPTHRANKMHAPARTTKRHMTGT